MPIMREMSPENLANLSKNSQQAHLGGFIILLPLSAFLSRLELSLLWLMMPDYESLSTHEVYHG